MARVVILGWGSLVWELGSLAGHVRGSWSEGGPTLRIEFSRKSTKKRNGALTLVIDETNGAWVPTRFIESTRDDPRDATCDLARREGCDVEKIGFIVLSNGERSRLPEVARSVRDWASAEGFDGVVWTDLGIKFPDFSVEKAIRYLKGLPPAGAAEARFYIKNAPSEIKTPLRTALEKDGWLDQAG